MKDLFDVASSSSSKTFGPFQELLVENQDLETIWEELQTRNRPLMRYLKKKMSTILKRANTARRAAAARDEDEDAAGLEDGDDDENGDEDEDVGAGDDDQDDDSDNGDDDDDDADDDVDDDDGEGYGDAMEVTLL